MVAYQEGELQSAYFLCTRSTHYSVLQLEPHNQTMLQFKKLLPIRLKLGEGYIEIEEEKREEEEGEAEGEEDGEEEEDEEEEASGSGEEGESEDASDSSEGSSESESSESSTELSTTSSTIPPTVTSSEASVRPTYPRLRGPRHWKPS
jgi:predicted transposase YdaD